MVLTDFGLSWYCWVTYMHSEFQPRHLINKPCKLDSINTAEDKVLSKPAYIKQTEEKNSFLWVQKILSCCEPQWFFVQLHFERDFSHLWTRVDTDFVLEKKFILCFTFFSFSFSLSFLPFPRNFHWLLLCFIVWYIQIIKSTLAYKKFPCLRKRKRFFLKHSMNQKLHLKWDKVVKSPENDWATISQNLIIYMVLYSIRRKFNSSTLFSGVT